MSIGEPAVEPDGDGDVGGNDADDGDEDVEREDDDDDGDEGDITDDVVEPLRPEVDVVVRNEDDGVRNEDDGVDGDADAVDDNDVDVVDFEVVVDVVVEVVGEVVGEVVVKRDVEDVVGRLDDERVVDVVGRVDLVDGAVDGVEATVVGTAHRVMLGQQAVQAEKQFNSEKPCDIELAS